MSEDDLSPEEIEAQRQKREADLLEEAYRFVLGDEKGRRVLWHVLSECGVFRLSMTGNSQTFFNEGMRNIGLRLLDRVMTIEPDAFAEMYREAQIPADEK